MTQPEVALWYWRHHAVMFDIYDDETAAAASAVSMEEWEEGVPIGVQFPDGRTVRLKDWQAYHDAEAAAQRAADAYREKQSTAPPRPTRKLLDPFEGQAVIVDADEPGWLGRSTPDH